MKECINCVFDGIIFFLKYILLMALERAHTSSSYDATRFVSDVSSERYTQSLIKKVTIPERGFDIQKGDFLDFDLII